MAQNEYIVEDRSFRTEADYKRALRDKDIMDRLRRESAGYSVEELEKLRDAVEDREYKFHTLLEQDFADELTDRIKQMKRQTASAGPKDRRMSKRQSSPKPSKQTRRTEQAVVPDISEEAVQEEIKRQERRRKWTIIVCALTAAACLGYFVIYIYYNQRTGRDYDELIALKEKAVSSPPAQVPEEVVINYTQEGERETPEVLDEYKNLLNKNKKLIGWLKIDDTNIDYPVMQTSDNEYYLDHNLNQEYDKNGSIFMDKDCDVIEPSTNLILYGHHMKSGKMFGRLDKYSDVKYYEKHKYIDFDTIYEKGIYEVMYVFRSRVYSEEEVVFKYYQFIDAVSEAEFNSNMKEMAAVSLYDTGVTASYGDRLLTLSTCDYQEKNGRFVVVAKKVAEKE